MKTLEIIFLSNNFIFSNVALKFLGKKIPGMRSIKAVSFSGFFHEKIAGENNPVLIIHSESIQRNEELEMLSKFNYRVFSKIILADSCMENGKKKFDFLPLKRLRFCPLNENIELISKNISQLLIEINDSETQSLKELSYQLSILRSMQFNKKFSEIQMKLFNLLPCNYKNEKMAEELGVSPRQYERLQHATAMIAGVENIKSALIKYAMDNGILKEQPDDFITDVF